MNMTLIGIVVIWVIIFVLGVFFTKPCTIERAITNIITLTMMLIIVITTVREKK